MIDFECWVYGYEEWVYVWEIVVVIMVIFCNRNYSISINESIL